MFFFFHTIRVTAVISSLKSAEALLTKKYRFIKPNTQQSKKTLDKIAKKEDEEITKKEITIETDDTPPIVDTSEIGCVIFIYYHGYFLS